MRLTFTEEETQELLNLIKEYQKNNGLSVELIEIKDKLKEAQEYIPSNKKVKAPKAANKTKRDTSIRKIENAKHLLLLEGKKINTNQIAKVAGISYNTANTYKYLFQ